MEKLGAGGDIPDRGNSMKRGIEERIISICLETHKPSRLVGHVCVCAVTDGQSPPYRTEGNSFLTLDNRQHKAGIPVRRGAHDLSPTTAPALCLEIISLTAEQRARV